MRKVFVLTIILLGFAATAQSQLVKSTPTKAGTPEDKALDDISNTTDPAQKLTLIDKFYADFGQGELAVLANELYVSYYSDAKNYPKVAEYSQKILALDADNFSAALHLARAQSEVGNVAGLFDAGEKIGGILVRYKAQTPPAGADAAAWKSAHDQSLADQTDQINYVESLMVNALYKVQAPAERATYAERYAAAFPDSPYAALSEGLAATSYQQAQDIPKMTAAAEKALTIDPNSADMLLLLADTYSSNGKELDKALAYSKKVIEILPAAKKPDSISGEDWKKRVTLQTGLAWSAEGQVLINRNDLEGAASAFRTAGPMLKSDTISYARNLYRLGFTYARQKKVPEAKAALTEATTFNTPFKALAQQTLDQLAGTTPAPKRGGRGRGQSQSL